MIGPVRRESSTVVVLVGAVAEPLLAGLARSSNVSVVRPPGDEPDGLTAAALALGQPARRRSPYVLVPADPLAGVAAEWAAMWDLTAGPGHAAAFEQQAAQAVAAGRAGRFELPDYYVVLTPGASPGDPADPGAGAGPDRAAGAGDGTGMYLGPLRAARPRRVEAVVSAADGEAAENTERVLAALRTLRHGPWWPPLDELIDSARHFFAGSLGSGGQPGPGGGQTSPGGQPSPAGRPGTTPPPG
jgi:hypothetical protein